MKTGVEQFLNVCLDDALDTSLPAVRVDDFDSGSTEKKRQWDLEMSPRLRENPAAELSTGQEVGWYIEKLKSLGQGNVYYNALSGLISSDEKLREIDPDTRLIVCVPVAALSAYDTVFNTLSLYSQQDRDILDKTLVLLHVNWPEDAVHSNEGQQKVGLTLEEINRARAQLPPMNIAAFCSSFDQEFVIGRNGIIGEAARRLYDVALMCVGQMKRNGQPDGDDVLIVRNDSDAKGMSRNYLSKMLDYSIAHRELDAFTGIVRWDMRLHEQYPTFGAITNFREIMQAAVSLGDVGETVMTVGINSAVRASVLAAVGSVGRGQYTGVGSDDRELGLRIQHARGNRKPASIKYVPGAAIDSSADRLLRAHLAGQPITRAWDNFSRESLEGVKRPDETPDYSRAPNPEVIERDINAMINEWFTSPLHVCKGVNLAFLPFNEAGEKIYDLNFMDGKAQFSLTGAGRLWLEAGLSARKDYQKAGRFLRFLVRSEQHSRSSR